MLQRENVCETLIIRTHAQHRVFKVFKVSGTFAVEIVGKAVEKSLVTGE